MNGQLLPAESLRPHRPARITQPCLEACAAFRSLRHTGWPDHGRCTNPRSRFCGYPVRIGRECPDFVATDRAALSPAG